MKYFAIYHDYLKFVRKRFKHAIRSAKELFTHIYKITWFALILFVCRLRTNKTYRLLNTTITFDSSEIG